MLNREDFVSILFFDDIESMEASYTEPSIYKFYYFPDLNDQQAFFARPTIKFTHKDDLNDSFELSRRWKKFGSPFDKNVFDKYVRKRLEAQLSDVGLMSKKFRERAKKNGVSVSRQQVRRWLSSREGQLAVAQERQVQLQNLAVIEREMPKIFQEQENEFIESFIRETGILSLSERSDDRKMWQRYGGDGRGFVLEFDAEHEFFSHRGDDKKTRKLLRKVFYRDSPIEDFWKNPYYLFSVKETSWSDEREWRMLKSLVDCQKIAIPGGQIICVLDVPPKLIKSVIFGYDFQTSFFGECTELLRKFDGAIKVQRACFDSVQGVIVIT